MRFAVLSLLAACPLLAAPVPKEFRKRGDGVAIVGAWKPADGNSAHFQFRADGTMRTWHGQNSGPALEWTWTNLDPAATPKRVTLTRQNGNGAYDCYYELTGDALTIAFITDKSQPVPERLGPARGLSVYPLTRDPSAK
jgi:hypothetical protein